MAAEFRFSLSLSLVPSTVGTFMTTGSCSGGDREIQVDAGEHDCPLYEGENHWDIVLLGKSGAASSITKQDVFDLNQRYYPLPQRSLI